MIFNLNYNDNNWSRLGLTSASTHELVKRGRQILIETKLVQQADLEILMMRILAESLFR